jgi:hypothetical protein
MKTPAVMNVAPVPMEGVVKNGTTRRL